MGGLREVGAGHRTERQGDALNPVMSKQHSCLITCQIKRGGQSLVSLSSLGKGNVFQWLRTGRL